MENMYSLRVCHADSDKDDFVQPIIFEECYALAESNEFIEKIKTSTNVSSVQ